MLKTEAPPLPQVGALRELAEDHSSRKRFLMMVGAGGAAAFSTLLAACGDEEGNEGAQGGGQTRPQDQQRGNQDLEIVKYALTLEHLENEFYKRVLGSGAVTDKRIAETAKRIQENEQEHVDALTDVVRRLGGNPEPPRTDFDPVIQGGPEKILETAANVENIGAAAYLGQAPRIQSKDILASALAIHTVEGRHAAALNRLVGESIVPDGAFAKPLSMEEVLSKVQPFIVK